MIDRYTKVLLTVIAVNMTIMVGWGAAKVLVPEVMAGVYDDPPQEVRIVGLERPLEVLFAGHAGLVTVPLHVKIAGPLPLQTCNMC